MSNFDFKKLRQQCRTTGAMLQETFKGTDNILIGVAQRDADVNWKQNNISRWKDTNWKKAHDDKLKQTMQTDYYKNNHSIGITKRTADPAWNKANSESKMKPIVTPFGIFRSFTLAVEYIHSNNLVPTRKTLVSVKRYVGPKIKSSPKEYYYISREEYIMLTGKDI